MTITGLPESKYRTLIEMMRINSIETPDLPAFEINNKGISFKQLWHSINRFASFLQKKKVRKSDRILIALPNGEDFFIAFFGAILSGGIAVPINPLSGKERIISIAELSEASVVVLSETNQKKIKSSEKSDILKDIAVVSVNDSHLFPIQDTNFEKIDPGDVAFIQYTSGSTGNPKGVKLTHSGILTNINQMIVGMKINSDDIFVSWLPLYHDMGLILMALTPFYLRLKLILMPTGARSLIKWVDTLAKTKATFTASPDFGYRMALLYSDNQKTIDLSPLRVALNAAESVRKETIDTFEKKFNCKNSITPAYGLAEATVGVSCWEPGKRILVDKKGFVSIGIGFPLVEMKILHNNLIAPSGTLGEIIVKSPAITSGYFNNPQESSKLFWKEEYIRTGDIGYCNKEGYFFICGRKKNIIIHGGQNISPQEIEETVDKLDYVRFSTAVGIDTRRLEGEQVNIVAEIKASRSITEHDLEEMIIHISQIFHDRFGFRPGRIYLVKTGAIPRTPNGKIQHTALKEQIINATLKQSGNILFPRY